MKKVIVLSVLFAVFMIFVNDPCYGQIVNVKEVVKQKGTDRVNSWIENGVDAGFDKIEQEAKEAAAGEEESDEESEEAETSEDQDTDSADKEKHQNSDTEIHKGDISGQTAAPSGRQKLESTTQYDFVPGDKILFFEDFSQDAIGDFPALWTSNGSGEVKTVNIAPGKWFHLNGEDAVYCYSKRINFPDNFIIEFDIIPDEEYRDGITLSLYGENPEDPKDVNDDLFPGLSGLHVTCKSNGWETKGYANNSEVEDLSGQAARNPVITGETNHVIIWIQKRRVRIYHQGAKTLDVPTNIHEWTKFDKIRFSGWDANSWPYITNIKITTASPDMRSKLLTEGKLVTYGITFDVNKAEIKPESNGTIKSIADVLKENPAVRVKITGHTDSDGDDAKNMELSKRRADAVKNELVSKYGIEASRIEAEGAGETKPVAANDSAENKAKNRRVEFIKM